MLNRKINLNLVPNLAKPRNVCYKYPKTIPLMKDKNIIRIFTFLSIILLFISFSQKAYCVDENCGESWSGLMCFLLGIFSLIFSLSGISWLLNPFMIISYIIPIKNITFKLAFSALALTFGLSFLLFDEIIKNEAGHYGKITGYEIGYWIWILSAVINLTGILIVKLKNNKNTHS